MRFWRLPHRARQGGDLERAVGGVARFARRYAGEFPSHPYLAGRCTVCGEATVFFCDDLRSARESLVCAHCRCTSRYRALARGILRAVTDLTGARADSLAALPDHADRRIAVYDTQVPVRAARGAYPVPAVLGRKAWIDLQLSVYRPSLPWGAAVERNVTNQSLETVTFPDASFDLVLTSDVMEHVRLASCAHQEIRRILRPGGAYVFTVPHDRGRLTTLERVRVVDPDDPERDELLMEPEYHGDANSPEDRALAYRVYGLDLDDELHGLGFSVDYDRGDDPEQGIVSSEVFYCRVTA